MTASGNLSRLIPPAERWLLARLRDGRRVHVIDPDRQAAMRRLVGQGFAVIVAEEDGMLIAEPTTAVLATVPLKSGT